MSENPEILHPSTGECRIWDCPCHEFALKTPQEASSSERMAQDSRNVKTPPDPLSASGMAIPDFEHDWNHAPTAYKRVTEREIAEYFYLRGVQSGRAEILTTTNGDLRELL